MFDDMDDDDLTDLSPEKDIEEEPAPRPGRTRRMTVSEVRFFIFSSCNANINKIYKFIDK